MLGSVYRVNGDADKEIKVFTKEELAMIAKSLEQARASARRLANKEGQPEKVAQEYGAYEVKVNQLIAKVAVELAKGAK